MKQVNVGILGATGAVGQEMIKILEERSFPVASLRPIASARSAGSKIMFRGQECTICLLYTSPSPRDLSTSRMPSSA